MYLILLCSLIVVGIGVERHLYYRAAKTDMNGFIERLAPAVQARDWGAAGEICRQAGGVAGAVAAQGIECLRNDVYHLESVLEGEASLAAAGLKGNLNHLSAIVTVAPLLGLLGTVIGMIGSFSVLNIKHGQPMAITGGVGEALVATASGLCVAILSMVVYSYFAHLLDRNVNHIERVCTLLIKQVKRDNSHETA